MRRYTSLLLISFTVVLVFAASTMYLAGYADRVEQSKTVQSIDVYTTLPVEQVAVLAVEYEHANNVKVNFVPLSSKDLLTKIKAEKDSASGADAVLADKETLQQVKALGALAQYNTEQADLVAGSLKDAESAWVGVWYDPIVFCANRDYLKAAPQIPETWAELADSKGIRIGLTDFLAAEASANLLFTLVAQYDEERVFTMLRKLHPQVVQYAKYLSTPVRMAGMGEVDISVAVQSEAIRYINEGFPLTLVYPTDGTAYRLTGAGILAKAPDDGLAGRQFVRWLLEDEAQQCLQQKQFFFVPTNRETLAYKSFSGKNLVLFENYSTMTAEQRHDLLDRWVKNIRLK